MEINNKVIFYLYKYTQKAKFLNILGFDLLKKIRKNNNINNLNYNIKQFNTQKNYKLNKYKLINIINKKNKFYLRFKRLWIKLRKKIIKKLGYYMKSKQAFMFLFICLQNCLSKYKDESFELSETNFIVILSNIIEKNCNNNNKTTKYLNKFLYISYMIYSIALKLTWLSRELKIINKTKKKYIIKFNATNFLEIIMQAINQSVQLPYLIPIKLKKNNILKEFTYNKNYEHAINYLNSQEICINQTYFYYLLYMDVNDLYILSDGIINLSSLNNINNKKNNIKTNENIINALKYLLHLFIVHKYCYKKFYFEYVYDWRGRIYQKSWPMNSLYTKITAPLYIFANNNYNKKYIYIQFDTIFWWKSYELNPYYILDIRDATNSMFQIAGCLTYDINLLKYTNINNDNIKYNIYDYILENINHNKMKLLSEIGYIHKENINKIDKDFIKQLIMPWSYNENEKTSIKKICNTLFKPYINKNNFTYYWNKSVIIHKFIFDIFNNKFRFYNILKQFFNILPKIICKNNVHIKINHNKSNTHAFIHKYFEQINKEFYIGRINNKSIYKKINIINEDKISIKDNKRALIANTIQYLDSILLIQVVLKCKELNIPIITNHDCFYTTIEHGKAVLKIYNNVLYEYLIDYNFLNDLITENNIDLNNKDKDIKKLNKIYNEILKTREQNKEYINNINFNNIKYSISLGKCFK